MFQSAKATKTIFYLNIIVFLFTLMFSSFIYENFAMYDFNDSSLFKPWQIITYQFLHGGLFHIVFNMLVLLSFGPLVEHEYGTKRFWIYYLLCGVASCLLHSVMLNSGDIPLVGASGSIWGVLMMFTFLYPNQKLYLFFIPIGIKAKYIVTFMFLFEVFGGFTMNDGTAHFGHVGGGLMGLILFSLYKMKILK